MPLLIGQSDTGQPVIISEKARTTHMQIVGATGSGKSKLLENMIRADIEAGRGLCLMDPNGELYKDIVRWTAACGWHKARRIHLLNPHMENYGFGFNPLSGSADPSVIVDAAVSAVSQVFGGQDMRQTPRLARILRTLFATLHAANLTVAEATRVLDPVAGRDVRDLLIDDMTDPMIAGQLRDISALEPREMLTITESTMNRLMAFLAPPVVRQIVGQSDGVDFRRVMDDGEILLVNLNPGKVMSDDNARLLGTLFVNALFANARTRGQGQRPFYLYIDECYRYLTDDVERILDEGRKYGLHLILAHQRLDQLAAAGDKIMSAVMTNAKTKIVFGGLTPEDAEIMESFLYMGTYDLQKVKDRITTPVTVAHDVVWMQSHGSSEGVVNSESTSISESTSRSTGTSDSEGFSESLGTGDSTSASLTESYDPQLQVWWGVPPALNASRGASNATSRSAAQSKSQSQSRSTSTAHTTSFATSTSRGHTSATSHGSAQTFKAILEERATQTYSLQDQRYERAADIRNLPDRSAILKLPNAPATKFTTTTIRPGIASETLIRAVNKETLERSPYTRPHALIETEIAARQTLLTQRVESHVQVLEPVTFRERKKPRRRVVDDA